MMTTNRNSENATAATAAPLSLRLLAGSALALSLGTATLPALAADQEAAEPSRDDRRAEQSRDGDRREGRRAAAQDEVPDTITVSGERINNSPKMTAPLRDMPQTITVIPADVMKDQNLLTLRDVLSTVPGITFGAGEGGGGYGDSVNLRGFTANSDIGLDGVRDSAQYTRSDSFNLEQIEVVSGPNSVYGGSGAVGGTINLVSKTPRDEDFTLLSGGVGTDSYGRVTVDSNQKITDTVGVRVNGMWHNNRVPNRDVEKFKRWGIAPSVAFGLGTATKLSLSYFYQHDDNIPQYGVPYFRNAFHNGPLPGADPSNYYGYSNIDTQEIDVNTATAILNHEFDDTWSVRNLTRWQQVTQFALVDPPQGTWCLSDGTNAANGAACATPGFYQPSGPRGNTRDTENTIVYNQTDLTAAFNTGGIQHRLVIGFAAFQEKFGLDTGNSLRNPGGALPNPVLPLMNIADPDHVWTGPVNFVQTASQDGTLSNQAVYVFDGITLNEHFELNGGVRYEHNKGDFTAGTYTSGAFTSQGELFENEDYLFSYRAGLVYKPVENASIYVAYGNSKTPSKSSVNGSCTALTCNVDPETALNYELGAKWDLLDNALSLTGSVFRNKRSNYKVASTDPTLPEQQLDGKSRVDGIALGAAGTITPDWRVFGNYTYLKSKVLQSVDDNAIQDGVPDPQAGNPLTGVPDHNFSIWTTYTLPVGVELGYGVTYQGEWYLNNGLPPLFTTKPYWLHRASVAYQVREDFELRLNVNNIFDKEYYTRVRNNGWATPGDGFSATLTANYGF